MVMSYWNKRALKLLLKNIKRTHKTDVKISEGFSYAFNTIEKDIMKYAYKLSKDLNLCYDKINKKLTLDEIKALAGRLGSPAINNYRLLTYKEAIRLEMTKTVSDLSKDVESTIFNHLKETYRESFYNTHFDIQSLNDDFKSIKGISKTRIEYLLKEPWSSDGTDFSTKIWANQSKLVDELYKEFVRAATVGMNLDKLSKHLSKRMDVGYKRARRLLATEDAYFSNKAALDAYKDSTAEGYEILSTLDRRTCEVCGSMDGKVYAFEDAEVGVTMPPFHPNCRCTIVGHFPDMLETERVARVEGKSRNVGNISYADWKRRFVEGENKSDYVEYVTEIGYNIGDDLGKFGKVAENPNITVNWDIQGEHYKHKMKERDISKTDVENWVKKGVPIEQIKDNKYAFVTKDGVAIVRKDGKLITAWSSADFDENMKIIIRKLFEDD